MQNRLAVASVHAIPNPDVTMTQSPIHIESIHIGHPRTYAGPQGTWRSSIFREQVEGPARLLESGLQGDEVADKEHHGWPNMAVCCHTLDDYAFWRQKLDLELQPGGVGENWTLANAREDAICLMDTYAVGTAQVQVSKPRTPCQKQARRVGRADWVKQVIAELRTGFYLQVLAPGTVQAGDTWHLLERPHPRATIRAVNRCIHQTLDPDLASELLQIPHLDPYWHKLLAQAQARAASA